MGASGEGAIARGNRDFLGKAGGCGVCDFEFAFGVVVNKFRLHVPAGAHVTRDSHAETGLVEVRGVGFARRGDGGLLDQAAARVEDVAHRALEDAHLEALEREFKAVAQGDRLGRGDAEAALEAACAVGVAGREVKELVEAASAFAGLGAVDGDGVQDDILVAGANGSDQGAVGFEIEDGLPGFALSVLPSNDGGIANGRYRDGA